MRKPESHYLDIGQLRVGVYVHLDLGWMDHPFTFSSFLIRDEDQIATLRRLGLQRIRYDPLRSEASPLPPAAAARGGGGLSPNLGALQEQDLPAVPASAAAQEPAGGTGEAQLPAAEAETGPEAMSAAEPATQPAEAAWSIQRLAQLQYAVDACEKAFVEAAREVRRIERGVHSQPDVAVQAADVLVGGIIDSVLSQGDIVIHALNGKRSGDEQYQHPLNVAVLALMLAKTLDMSAQDARLLGVAALFHDSGKDEVPKKILMQTEPLTRAEQSFLQRHCEFGAALARRIGLPERGAEIILQHHELMDGSGYPRRLRGEQIDPLARLLALVNVYDNLCNPPSVQHARTPYEALAYMFAHQRSKYDSMLLNLLIKSLGVYPPGSIVLLSDGSYGIVVCVNPSKPLRPYVMIHDNRPGDVAPSIVDLSEAPTLSIVECLRRSQLPEKVLERLNPRKRICYFLDRDRMARGQA